jgi:NAD+ kinase
MMAKMFGVIANKRKPNIGDVTDALISWLEARNMGVLVWDDLSDCVKGGKFASIDDVADQSDIVIALGGDGTLLRAARAVGDRLTPILGVNIGSLGFLTEVTVDEVYEALEEILSDGYRHEDRMNIDAVVRREGEATEVFTALNDMVINKGALSRVIEMKIAIGCDYLATYTADGLIVSTPTGSTAYSLSAGGPIVNPCMEAIIATPICPHTLAIRPMILAPDQELAVDLAAGHSLEGEPEVRLTIDGQIGYELLHGDRITFRKSERKTRLVLSGYRTFYEVLRGKLKWGDIERRS